jgi:bifunctional non-homologous end joining protein LigD
MSLTPTTTRTATTICRTRSWRRWKRSLPVERQALPPVVVGAALIVPADLTAWSFEVKWDGWRALVCVDGGLKVRTRSGRQVSDSLPELASLVDALGGRSAILDGELVACPDGVVDFYALAPRMLHSGRMASWAARELPVTFVAFDLLHLDGEDLTSRPLVERKGLLDELQLVGSSWATNGWYEDGETLFDVCAQLGHEGVVAKRLDSPYVPGTRTRTWLKRKTDTWKRVQGPLRRPREAVRR